MPHASGMAYRIDIGTSLGEHKFNIIYRREIPPRSGRKLHAGITDVSPENPHTAKRHRF